MNEPTALQKAFYTIRKLKQLLNEQKQTLPQPIAIIGLSCRFPEAMNKEAYWRLLSNGKEAISELPEARWELLKGTSQAASRDKNCHYWGSYLTDIDAFDAYFFGISPREAKLMEPEQRGLLEVAYEAIEDAGLPIESLEGSNTGVFAGLDASQFAHLQKLDGDVDALYLATGNATSIAANRISYVFDLHGPSMVIDTACSASLVALHLACLNLQNKLCDLALVGGANINLLPIVNLLLSKAKMLSPDGKCKTFDANASGYAPGEGIGVMVLKPLDKALQNKDRIYAVIEGSGVNQDGRTNGLTAPNGLQQEALIEAVYAKANIDPRLISYVECHGTGTFLGDPIEVQALGEVVSKNRTAENPCWIGSVKTNMGHLEPAAGIAGMIKVALSLQQKKIPPHLNFSTPNPHIPFNKYHFRVPQQIEEWPKYGSLRIAGVSGFGFGGTNAHVVMREISDEENQAISLATDSTCEKEELFTLSAKDTDALKSLIEKWCNYLAGNFSLDLSALCYNLHLRRSHYTSRLAIVVRSTRELYDFLCTLRENLLSSAENIFMSKPSNTPWISNTPFAGTETPIEDLHTLAAHYVNHGDIDWKQYERERNYPYQDMPLYPWQHKHYWPSLQENSTEKTESVPIDFYPLQGKKLMASPLSAFEFAFQFNTQIMPEIADTYHIIHVGYYLDMLAFAVKQISGQVSFTVENLVFLSPLMAPDGITVNVHVALQKLESDAFNVSFYSCVSTEEGWTEHAKSMLFIDSSCDKKIANIPSMTKRCPLEQDAKLFYNRITSMGLPAGNSIRWTQKYWLGKEEILCEFSAPNVSNKGENFVLNVHPGVIDASIQPLFKLLP